MHGWIARHEGLDRSMRKPRDTTVRHRASSQVTAVPMDNFSENLHPL
jgi:hypothetical protein